MLPRVTYYSAIFPSSMRNTVPKSTAPSTRASYSAEANRLFIEPDVLEARAVVDAVDHADQILDVGSPAGDAGHIQDVRARILFDQLPLDLPNQLPPLVGVGFPRLPLDQLVNRLVAISGVIAHRAKAVIFVELIIRIIDLALGDVEPDFEILAHQPGIPLRCIDSFKLAVDINLFQLRDQDHRRVSPGRNVPSRDGDGKPVVGAVAEFLHDLPRFGAPRPDIGAVARQGRQHLGRHAPQPLGRRLHWAADRALSLAHDVDECLAVQGQRHRAPQLGFVEGWRAAIDDQVAAAIHQVIVADRFRHLSLDVLELRDRDPEIDVGLTGDEA